MIHGWQGRHYGFKLHAGIDQHNNLTGIYFTPADGYDAQSMEQLVKGAQPRCWLAIATTEPARCAKRLWNKYKIPVIAPPHYKQNKQLMSGLQFLLLNMRFQD